MQYKRSIKSLAAIVLVSFILAGCGISVDKNKLLGELSDCYPEDTFTFEEMNPVGIITVTSELYPDETILLQSKDDVTESTYPGKVYKDYVDGFFTDLAGECFEGCGIDISWVGRTKFYPIEEINREEFMERYVYDESDQAKMAAVQYAVEDLIVDEMGLELAFEGTRFSDLCRVAWHRRAEGAGDYTDYLAKRVAKRHTGEIDEALRSRLMVEDNWWLPIPEK